MPDTFVVARQTQTLSLLQLTFYWGKQTIKYINKMILDHDTCHEDYSRGPCPRRCLGVGAVWVVLV